MATAVAQGLPAGLCDEICQFVNQSSSKTDKIEETLANDRVCCTNYFIVRLSVNLVGPADYMSRTGQMN